MGAACHRGAVRLGGPAAPPEVTPCDCPLCHRDGVLWAHFASAGVRMLALGPTAMPMRAGRAPSPSTAAAAA